jgi:hypothetical protein
MQGSWTVSFKSKSAAFPQRFIIQGAASGNGTYAGEASTPPVYVTGSTWSINIQHDPGTGWINSEMQWKFPTVSSGQYRVDIESNDSGGDVDFNDLILTCSTPVTATDFILYGNASCYSGSCIFNPCYPFPFVVLESASALQDALKRPVLRKALEVLYPERIIKIPPPLPDPPPFRPIVLPVEGQAPLPPKRAQLLQVRQDAPAKGQRSADVEAEVAEEQILVTSAARIVTVAEAKTNARLKLESLAIGRFRDMFKRFCDTDSMAGIAIRFQEYDRTAAELAGGPYTGEGRRENLGVTITDRNGNYVFRFSRSLPDFLGEAFGDVGTGEGVIAQIMPDVIAQILDPVAPSGVSYESSPYWNIPLLRRINICVPCTTVPTPTVCPEGLIIQRVGNITIGPVNPDGTRTTSGTFLGTTGRITNTSSLGPKVQCAAWAGSLYLYACLNNSEIAYYTIRYKRPSDSDWKFAKDLLSLPRLDPGPPSAVVFSPVGWFIQTLEIDGSMQPAQAYRNVETAVGENWLSSWVNLKIVLNSETYENEAGTAGPMQFRIEGYRADGTKFAGADDTVTLYLDNSTPSLFIDPNVTMINTTVPSSDPDHEVTLGNCALFTLPTPAAPLRVRFRANQNNGFMQEYELYMQKGATGTFAVNPPPPAGAPFRTRAYIHGDNLACNSFFGTLEDPTYDFSANTVSVDLTPSAPAGWLESTETFCAFAVRLSASVRVTNGQGVFGPYNEPVPILIGIQKP